MWGILVFVRYPKNMALGDFFAREAVSHFSGFLEKEGLKVCL